MSCGLYQLLETSRFRPERQELYMERLARGEVTGINPRVVYAIERRLALGAQRKAACEGPPVDAQEEYRRAIRDKIWERMRINADKRK